jgi:hypothetical protein
MEKIEKLTNNELYNTYKRKTIKKKKEKKERKKRV